MSVMNIRSQFPDYRTKLSLEFSYLPQIRSDDVFIIAHPRSGSTWLRTMLVNIMQRGAHSNPDVFNRLIPSPSVRSIRSILNTWSLSSPRVLTSHTSYLPGLPKVVYLVRDGRDVLVSYYHYVVHRKSKINHTQVSADAIDFPEFFERYYQGYYRYIWHQHVESWLTRGKQALGERMLVVRFEEMQSDPQSVVSQIALFAGLTTEPDQVAAAVREADLENMRKIEKQRWQAKGLGTPDKTSRFYRSGRSKNWKSFFTPELREEFLSRSAKAMRLSGYRS